MVHTHRWMKLAFGATLVWVAAAEESHAKSPTTSVLMSARWQATPLCGGEARFEKSDATMRLWRDSGSGLVGVHSDEALIGHFEVEADFATPFGGGIAISATDNESHRGVDLLGIVAGRDDAEHAVVRVVGLRGGRPLPSGTLKASHRHVLDRRYSLPFDEPDGRMKIARNRLSGTFHLYYGVKKRFGDRVHKGWIELSPLPDWLGDAAAWRPTLIAADADSVTSAVECRAIGVRFLPERDADDRNTGFSAVRRSHSWSGFSGEALVVSFDERFRYVDRDYKLVFWELANYVPVWRFDNQTLLSYEFVETWDPKGRGCYEPMSDRLGVASHVVVVEDNAVRKVVEWRYELLNANYQTPREGQGQQRAQVVERYVCYPDGRVIRHVVYTPKLDSEHRSWNELAELIVIAGNRHHPEELLSAPAMTVSGGRPQSLRYYPGRPSKLNESDSWPTITAAVHLNGHADVIVAFSNQPTPITASPGNRVRANVSWHATHHRMSHWPVSLEPYQSDHKSIHGERRQVTHTSLAGIAAVGDDSWSEGYEVDQRGRRFRQWSSLLALTQPHDTEARANAISSWLFPGELDTAASPGVSYARHNAYLGEVVLRLDPSRPNLKTVHFRWMPDVRAGRTFRPCLRLIGLQRGPISVVVDNIEQTERQDYAIAWQDDSLLLWMNFDRTDAAKVVVQVTDDAQ